MTIKGKLATILIALTFFGCKGTQQSSAASAGEGVGTASSGGTRVEYITDPSMDNMQAGTVTIPAKWHFQGALLPGSACDITPFFVFRASSPDGLSYIEHLPMLSWAWESGPMAGKHRPGCLPLESAMRAQEFLKYLAGTLKVEYVSDVPIPAEVNAALLKSVQAYDTVTSLSTLKNFSEKAAAMVSYKNGTFTMKGLLNTTVNCHETDWQGSQSSFPGRPGMAPSTVHQCSADVRYLVAPESQFEAVKKIWDTPGMGGKLLAPWFDALQKRNQEQNERILAQQRQTIAQQNGMLARQSQQLNAQLQAQHQQFVQSQALQQHMHEEFMSSMQRGTDMSMARTQAGMNARSTATSDWVDYALDQRTVMDPNTGQMNKVSSSYSYTWVDSSGKNSYQTNDPNANPNGTMQGSWTKQQVVHGDGTQ